MIKITKTVVNCDDHEPITRFLVIVKEAFGSGKEAFGSGKEAFGSGKEAFGSGKEAFGRLLPNLQRA
ncbi:MAG: hypothetical protein H6662_18085 [Ardenticatenaceae bacterium]|nr:hypothetical protein [Ardenticatenaceae bacterium]